MLEVDKETPKYIVLEKTNKFDWMKVGNRRIKTQQWMSRYVKKRIEKKEKSIITDLDLGENWMILNIVREREKYM